ncbi:DUF6538 domain-containing protein [Magnetospirillum moscoviense]|nr:DUF6538 domain-containing protein [Magnetospirillum moscoviense]
MAKRGLKNLRQRRGVYYYARRVPTDLVAIFGKAHITPVSLRTNDPAVAEVDIDALLAVDDQTRGFIQRTADQLLLRHELGALPGEDVYPSTRGEGTRYRRTINRALSLRTSNVDYRIGSRKYAWIGGVDLDDAGSKIEEDRNYKVVDIDT